jgi:adhesin transport system membrane fusion protein
MKDNFRSTRKLELSPLVQKVWLISLTIVAIMISILFLPWEQTAKGNGTIVAYDPSQRDYTMLATIDGYIDNFYVHENQFVKKGTPLYSMVDLDMEYSKRLQEMQKATQEQSNNIKNEIKNLKANKKNMSNNLDLGLKVYEEKLIQIKDKIRSLELKKHALKTNYETKKINFERVKSLYENGIESKREYDKAENIFIKADAELKKVAVDIEIQERHIEILKKEQNRFLNNANNKIKVIQNSILNAVNRSNALQKTLNQQETGIQRYESREVVAKKDGYVVRIFNNDKDKYIKRGDKILYFSPAVTQKALLLKVSDFNMPLIKEGLPVRLMFYGWPALQVSGWPKIQFGSFGGVVAKVEKISHEKGFYYAYVLETEKEPWPVGDKLRIGTQATAWVRLSTVPLWYQIWRLMNALPPKMVHPNAEKY